MPESIQRALKIHLVETVDEVLRLALLPKPRAARAQAKSPLLAPSVARGAARTHGPRDRH